MYPGASSQYIKEAYKNGIQTDIDVCCAIAHYSYVNCWHIKEYESAAMWDIYSGNSGIVIKSTYDQLKKCFKRRNVLIKQVSYIDFEKEWTGTILQYEALKTKRKSFECEEELRVIIPIDDTKVYRLLHNPPEWFQKLLVKINEDYKNWKLNLRDEIARNYLLGVYRPIDVDLLIDSIYLSPQAPDYLFKAIKTVLSNMNFGHKKVKRSVISELK